MNDPGRIPGLGSTRVAYQLPRQACRTGPNPVSSTHKVGPRILQSPPTFDPKSPKPYPVEIHARPGFWPTPYPAATRWTTLSLLAAEASLGRRTATTMAMSSSTYSGGPLNEAASQYGSSKRSSRRGTGGRDGEVAGGVGGRWLVLRRLVAEQQRRATAKWSHATRERQRPRLASVR